MIGTLGYLAPEQLDGHRAGPPADIFALGAVVVFAATGVGPFVADSPHGLLYRMAFGEPDLENVPPGLRPMLSRMLDRSPEHRRW